MKTTRHYLTAALIAIAASAYAQKPLPADHPLLGSWKLTLPGGVCSEIYTFRADGTRVFASGQETGESAFLIAEKPSSKGFYRFVDTIKKTNGKPDCSGQITPIGHESTLFIAFHAKNRDEAVMCRDESLARCVALKREKP